MKQSETEDLNKDFFEVKTDKKLIWIVIMSGKSIKEKNLFNGFDEENLMIVLEKCGFKPNKIDEEEVFETIANTNITNEEDKQNSEQKEIDEVMREIEDLI